MATIAFVVHPERPEAAAIAREVTAWLQARGHVAVAGVGRRPHPVTAPPSADGRPVAVVTVPTPVARRRRRPGREPRRATGPCSARWPSPAPTGRPVLGREPRPPRLPHRGRARRPRARPRAVPRPATTASRSASPSRWRWSGPGATPATAAGASSCSTRPSSRRRCPGHTIRVAASIAGRPFVTYAADGAPGGHAHGLHRLQPVGARPHRQPGPASRRAHAGVAPHALRPPPGPRARAVGRASSSWAPVAAVLVLDGQSAEVPRTGRRRGVPGGRRRRRASSPSGPATSSRSCEPGSTWRIAERGRPMLVELRVRDLGVIESVALDLGPGMTALTGETGAGKTLLVDALELLVGGRADPSLVRPGASEALVEGRFVVDDDEIILARAVPAHGTLPGLDRRSDGPGLGLGRGRGPAARTARPALPAVAARRAPPSAAPSTPSPGSTSSRSPRRASERRALHDGARVARGRRPRPGPPGRPAALPARRDRRRRAGRPRRRRRPRPRRRVDWPRPRAHREAAATRTGRPRQRRRRRAPRRRRPPGRGTGRARRSSPAGGAGPHAWPRCRPTPPTSPPSSAMSSRPGTTTRNAWRRSGLAANCSDELSRKYGEGPGGRPRLRRRGPARCSPQLDAAEGRAGELQGELDERRVGRASRPRPRWARLGAGPHPTLAGAVEKRLRGLAMPHARIEVTVAEPDPGDDVTFLLGANPGEAVLPLAKVASGGELARAMLALRLVLTDAPSHHGLRRGRRRGGRRGGPGGRAAPWPRWPSAIRCSWSPTWPRWPPAPGNSSGCARSVDEGRTVAHAAVLEDDDRVVELARMLSGRPGSATARRHAEELLGRRGPRLRRPTRAR